MIFKCWIIVLMLFSNHCVHITSNLCYGTNNGLTDVPNSKLRFKNCTIFVGNLEATFLDEKDFDLFKVF